MDKASREAHTLLSIFLGCIFGMTIVTKAQLGDIQKSIDRIEQHLNIPAAESTDGQVEP